LLALDNRYTSIYYIGSEKYIYYLVYSLWILLLKHFLLLSTRLLLFCLGLLLRKRKLKRTKIIKLLIMMLQLSQIKVQLALVLGSVLFYGLSHVFHGKLVTDLQVIYLSEFSQ